MHATFRISSRLRQPPRQQRRSARRHVLDNGQRAAVLRAVTAGRLYTTKQVTSFKDAAESCGANLTYVQAAVVLLRAEDTRLLERVLEGEADLLKAAAQVKRVAQLLDAYRRADNGERVVFARAAGIGSLLDTLVAAE
jgi:hypothetical protein